MTIHYSHTCGEKMGDRRKQDLGKVDKYRHTCGKKWQIRGGQDLRKVGPPSNTGTHVGDDGPQAEARGDKTSGR